jgi:lipopolysaccharide export system protein LptA
MKSILFCSCFLLGMLSGAASYAEKADASKEMITTAESAVHDDVKQVTTFSGNVLLNKGTLVMKAGKIIIKTDPAGYSFATLLPGPSGFTTFRQKRDGGDLWVEGQAQRIEYDNKTDMVKLFMKAKLKQLEGVKPTNEMEGEFISYDSRNDLFSVSNNTSGTSRSGGERVKVVIQPRIDKQEK